MKKTLLFLTLVFSLFVVIPSAFAIDLGTGLVDGAAQQAGFERATETTVAETIGGVINIALSFVGTIFLVLMVYAGIIWMRARGNDADVEKAQDIIRAAMIGLVIAVGAYGITNFVVPRIVGQATGDPVNRVPLGGACQTTLECPIEGICRAGRCVAK